ncbi:hypothetical protein BN946_scf185015.g59 [Trametes cinnabarina]|uniref:Charged multivesicular body protein 5 n=1 Tax=Pycnoporus cinnabarinus TaxID=5643 RepID=A0A060SHS1_PYCCI|nr:hypothetical protein BN946_scf185015.g59 [Trametes cinnabarina]
MGTLKQHRIKLEQLFYVMSGDPSRGSIALDTDAAPAEGTLIQMFFLPSSSSTDIVGEVQKRRSVEGSRRIQDLIFATTSLEDAHESPTESEELEDVTIVLDDVFLAASENGCIVSRSVEGSSERAWKCDTRMASIEVKIKKLDGELARYKEQMSRLRNGPGKNAIQERALRTLKQKRMYEAQLAQLTQQTFNMESAALATENLRNTMATVDAMKQANKEMRKQYGKIDVDKIESIHYDMEDLLEQANEIQETLGRSYAVPDEIDEADLQAELDALELDVEEEGPSYLSDLNKAPDFVDEPPVELSETPEQKEAVKTTA